MGVRFSLPAPVNESRTQGSGVLNDERMYRMSKFNTPTKAQARGSSFIQTSAAPNTHTAKGAPGYSRDQKSELFLNAVSNFIGETAFHESATSRDSRLVHLARAVAVSDLEWSISFVTWLRGDGNMRSASLVIALEGAYALNNAGIPGGRRLVAAALSRADEPGEALAYWYKNFGRVVPKSVKRGIADAATKSYNEFSLGKYDTKSYGFRFGDVINLVHPTPANGTQSALFKYALDRRHNASSEVSSALPRLAARAKFNAMTSAEVKAALTDGTLDLAAGGLTWENLAGKGAMDAKSWEAIIPSMGYMALLRNLRNFEDAGVRPSVLADVAKIIADSDEVAKSRQFPMRFLSAYRATKNSLTFSLALERALSASLSNVPVLKGKTLILVDRSGSMFYSGLSSNSGLDFADSAAIFGTVLALRAEDATLVQFGSLSYEVALKKSSSILKALDEFRSLGSTDANAAVRKHLKNHDRVVIITDEQYDAGVSLPDSTPLYTFNLVGYENGGTGGKNRYNIGGGLTDSSFRTIDLIERGEDGRWPWED